VPTCPVCDSPQVLISLASPRRAVCRECGARWSQGDEGAFSAEPSTIPNVVGVIRPGAAGSAGSVSQLDRRS
jgi:hypothetical protein